jgi:hypothetical protein
MIENPSTQQRVPVSKIPGKPEGRPGIWVITAKTAKSLVQGLPSEDIHNMLSKPPAPMLLGATWKKAKVVEHLDHPGLRVVLLFAPQITRNHQLVTAADDRCWMFDIGRIDEARMEQKHEKAKSGD